MNRLLVSSLRVALVVLAGLLLLGQVVVPVVASETAGDFPEVAHLVVPYSVVAILALLALQVALVGVWRLLSLAAQDEVFTEPAGGWTTLVAGCVAVATALACGTFAHLLLVERVGGPSIAIGFAVSLVGGSAAVLVLVVLRALLGAATADRRELAEVI